jgi:replicative DNA helicase Mcm
LGAANPKFGRFDPYQPVAQQIELAPTLINRFDLIFVMKDIPERIKDEAIASHVLREHRGTNAPSAIDPTLLKKYFAFAKQKVAPELTEQAIEEIKKFYVDLRNAPQFGDDLVRPIPISARQLEALIRLSEASAKARLSKKVTREDAKRAIQIMHFYLLQVGIDKETGNIDIDRITTGIPSSERNKMVLVRDALVRLENKLGKLIPLPDLLMEVQEKVPEEDMDDILDKLKRSGDIFEPKRGFVQRV